MLLNETNDNKKESENLLSINIEEESEIQVSSTEPKHGWFHKFSIFFNNQEHQKVNPPKTKEIERFKFLDGFRGSLAIVVVITHTSGILGQPIFWKLARTSQKYGISGFFLLSAFLLTYRLIMDFYKPNSSLILCVLQYFIRRFFRIYLTAALFTAAAVYGPHFFEGFQTGLFFGVKAFLKLEYPGHVVLWTLIPEIRYYFIIPFICLAFYLTKHLQPLFLIAGIALTAYDQYYNIFNISWGGIRCGNVKNFYLKNHFFVFFIGTLFAMTFLLLERNKWLMELIKNVKVQLLLILVSMSLAPYAIYYHSGYFLIQLDFRTRSTPAIFWSIILLMCLLNQSPKNPLVVILNNRFLKSCGKYSFGMYLLHPGAIDLTIKTFKITNIYWCHIIVLIGSYMAGFLFYHVFEKHMITIANILCNRLRSLRVFRPPESQSQTTDDTVNYKLMVESV